MDDELKAAIERVRNWQRGGMSRQLAHEEFPSEGSIERVLAMMIQHECFSTINNGAMLLCASYRGWDGIERFAKDGRAVAAELSKDSTPGGDHGRDQRCPVTGR